MSIIQTVHFNTVLDTSETDVDKLILLLKLVEKQCPIMDITKNPAKIIGSKAFLNTNN